MDSAQRFIEDYKRKLKELQEQGVEETPARSAAIKAAVTAYRGDA